MQAEVVYSLLIARKWKKKWEILGIYAFNAATLEINLKVSCSPSLSWLAIGTAK